MSFSETIVDNKWEDVSELIYETSASKVEDVLSKGKATSIEDFAALISPAAEPYLKDMMAISHRLTQQRFGKTLQMYIPLYLSNECQNICTYCGFSLNNQIPRKTLTLEELEREVDVIKGFGFDHVLLVTGESSAVSMDYFRKVFDFIRPQFSNISMEVQPLETDHYSELTQKGLHTVLVYQETYNEENYKKHHPKGRKSNFWYRLDTPERLGEAEVHKIGLGVLIGLEDWRTDSAFCTMHYKYLMKKFWKTKFSISFPRLRPISGGIDLKSEMSEKQLLQLIGAWRMFDEDLELSLSTRERESFRNAAIYSGVTSISAGSKTDPGGYASDNEELEQFEISDDRSPQDVAKMIRDSGYEVVWKDWDRVYQ